MSETSQSILAKLQNNEYSPLYFLQGDEPFFIDQVSDFVEENAIDEGLRGFNQTILYGKETDLQTIMTHAREFPMMAERRVIIVKEAQELTTINKELGEKLLGTYAENPQPSTVLVFCYKYKSLDKRKKLFKALDQHAIVMNSTKMYDNQLPTWVEGFVKSKGFKIDQKAVHLIVENIGNNLSRISNEIDKMLVNFGEEKDIKPDHVFKYIGISKEYNVFELQKALAYKNVLKANEIIKYFESDLKKNPIIPVIAILFSFFNKVLLVHHSKDKSDRAVASLLKVNPFFVKEYMMAAKNYHLANVIRNISFIREADLRSKGIDNVSIKDGQILKELVFKLMH
ncbi:MAG: DNA polymerase III subunit delta [Cyclobacteriaceae bacterium]